MHNTTTELLHLFDLVLRGLIPHFDSGSVSSLIAFDFSKAFDTVNHELLLAKLDHYNLSSSALSLMYSFLIGRSQRVLRAPFPPMSFLRNIPSGVSQGSVFEPLLFSIFTANLASVYFDAKNFHLLTTLSYSKSFLPYDVSCCSFKLWSTIYCWLGCIQCLVSWIHPSYSWLLICCLVFILFAFILILLLFLISPLSKCLAFILIALGFSISRDTNVSRQVYA